jgi:WD40-like Beta Propeller Repeat
MRGATSRIRRTLILVPVALAVAVAITAASATASPKTSPQWILFTAIPPAIGGEQIFRIQASGKGLEQLTTGNTPSEAPAFSPDGKRVAFTRVGTGIFTMNLDGTGLRRLTSNGRDGFPAWSPNGKQIAFIRPVGKAWKIYVMSASGSGQRRLPQAPSSGRPTWTARGLVIPTIVGDLAKIDPQSGRVQKLFGALIDASVGLSSTAVAPDLSTLTYEGPRPPELGDKGCGEGVPCPRFGLFIEDLRSHKAPRLLVPNAGPASFSHDGQSLAFVAKNRLVIRRLKSGTSSSVATGKFAPSTSAPPAWQPR